MFVPQLFLLVQFLQPTQWKDAEATWLAPDRALTLWALRLCTAYFPCQNVLKFLTESAMAKYTFYLLVFVALWRSLEYLGPLARAILMSSILVISLFGDFIANLLKHATLRLRPQQTLQLFERVNGNLSFSFPSNHAFNLWALTSLLWILHKRGFVKKAWIHGSCAVVALVVSIARVFMGSHYPSDVLGGWLLGTLYGAISINFCLFLCERLKVLPREADTKSDG